MGNHVVVTDSVVGGFPQINSLEEKGVREEKKEKKRKERGRRRGKRRRKKNLLQVASSLHNISQANDPRETREGLVLCAIEYVDRQWVSRF